MTDDDYLWSGTGEPDDDTRRLEEALSRRRWRPRPLDLGADEPLDDADDDREVPSPEPDTETGADDGEAAPVAPVLTGWRRLVGLGLAAAMTLFFLGDGFDWFTAGTGAPLGSGGVADSGYSLEAIDGLARLERLAGDSRDVASASVEPGDRIVCAADARARLRVGSLGSVVLEPDSALRVDTRAASDGDERWRLYLERGGLRASIFAAPRIFQVGTPSGIAVDLGCIYTARVEDDGTTWLAVESGRVSFETGARRVLVPEGARVVAFPVKGPGTPVWEDAPVEVQAAVERLDRAALTATWGEAEAQALLRVVATEDPRDSLTLWHLLDHPRSQVVDAAFTALARFVPPPPDVTPTTCSQPGERDAWRADFEGHW